MWVQKQLDFQDDKNEPLDEFVNFGTYSVPLSRPRYGKQIAVRSTVDIMLKTDQPRLNRHRGAVLEAELSVDGWALVLDKDQNVMELGPNDFRLAKDSERGALPLGRR